jgi:hypothetical protein
VYIYIYIYIYTHTHKFLSYVSKFKCCQDGGGDGPEYMLCTFDRFLYLCMHEWFIDIRVCSLVPVYICLCNHLKLMARGPKYSGKKYVDYLEFLSKWNVISFWFQILCRTKCLFTLLFRWMFRLLVRLIKIMTVCKISKLPTPVTKFYNLTYKHITYVNI